MQPTFLSQQAIRTLERQGLSQGLPLMQRAGQCAAEFVMQHYSAGTCVWLLVGPGNNGGDALAAGLVLQKHGYLVHAIMPCSPQLQAQDARQQLKQWHTQAHSIRRDWLDTQDLMSPQLLIDGLFGIGLNKQLGEPWQSLIDWANTLNVPILALDIPSGLMADTGECLGRPIQAHWTLAFIAASLALKNPENLPYTGQWQVCPLGLNI